MSSMRFSARLDMSHLGPPRPFKDAGVVVDNLRDTHNAICLFVFNRDLGVPTDV
jgi:hypothetical protein